MFHKLLLCNKLGKPKKEVDIKNQENDRLKMENDEFSQQENFLLTVFPLLSLPDELIAYILSFLRIKDRMKARLCKRLDNIEFKNKYYVPSLLIHERATADPNRFNNRYITNHKQYFVLLKENVYSIDCFKRLIQNAKFGYLAINMSGRGQFHWELYTLIKECDVDELALRLRYDNEIVVDSFVDDLMNTCCKLNLDRPAQLTVNGMHSIYTKIRDRSSKMNSIDFGDTRTVMVRQFLKMVGIRFENGNLFSARDIEAYESTEIIELAGRNGEDDYECFLVHKHVFDGNLEMKFGQEDYNENEGWLSLKYYESNEDLQKAKTTKGFVRIVVTPE